MAPMMPTNSKKIDNTQVTTVTAIMVGFTFFYYGRKTSGSFNVSIKMAINKKIRENYLCRFNIVHSYRIGDAQH